MKDSRTPRLFAPADLVVRPSAAARLRRLATLGPRAATPGERRRDEERDTVERLRRQGADLARRFGLKPHVIEAEREGVNGHYGICYEDGLILIRLRHARTGRLLKESSLVDTLCHELAHLRHLDHSPRFRRLYERILEAARESGYYRPGPAALDERPRQLALFQDEDCGTSRPPPRRR